MLILPAQYNPIMRKLFLLIILFCSFITIRAEEYILTSPNEKLKTVISVDEDISFKIIFKNEIIVENCIIDMAVAPGPIFSDTPVVIGVEKDSHSSQVEPIIKYKSKFIKDEYNYLTLSFKKKFKISFRAYDEGIAYRFSSSFDDTISILNETFDISFQGKITSQFPKENSMISHYERMYLTVSPDTLDSNEFCSLPMLVQSDVVNILITESGLSDYPGMFLRGDNKNGFVSTYPNYVVEAVPKDNSDRNQKITSSYNLAITKGKRDYPWRILIITDNDSELITSQLVYLLADENKIEDPSWIVPGKVAWDWYNANNIYGVDFKSGINTETYRYYIDFASEYGLEYIILDEGWSKSTTKIDEPNPDIDIEELIKYGKSKNVGIILWVLWEPLDKDMSVLELYNKWGAKGIKVDFMQRADQYMVNYYERVAKKAAKNKLLVDFHGAYKPSGLRRAYPNVLTYEGLKGNENNKWSSLITSEHNLTIPFIRMVAGPMDFTPGAMRNRTEANHVISWNRPASIGTRCHQVAMYVIYESPLQMLCESPSTYYKEDETTRFISKIPAIWDETIVIEAKVGDYILVARRNGKDWFIGAMTDKSPREFEIDLSFLPTGNYVMEVMHDGKNAEKYAEDYNYETNEVTNELVLNIELAPEGGYAAILKMK